MGMPIDRGHGAGGPGLGVKICRQPNRHIGQRIQAGQQEERAKAALEKREALLAEGRSVVRDDLYCLVEGDECASIAFDAGRAMHSFCHWRAFEPG